MRNWGDEGVVNLLGDKPRQRIGVGRAGPKVMRNWGDGSQSTSEAAKLMRNDELGMKNGRD